MTHGQTAIATVDVRPLRRLMQINVCLLACLAGMVFAAGEESPLALLSVPIAIGGLLLIDLREARGLPVILANLAGLGAFVAAGMEFFGGSIEGRLLGFGHLLVYLGWIMMLQAKGKAQFWWLCALSSLQVATASVLTNQLWFPLAAILFMVLALWTLSVFSLDCAVTRAAGVEKRAQPSPRDRDAVQTAASRSRSYVRSESAARLITSRFIVGVALNCVVSLLLGLTIFVLTPRVWARSFLLFSDTYDEGLRQTGFAEEVSLGQAGGLGDILESADLVLEVEFVDNRTGAALDVEQAMFALGYDAPVFRGRALEIYEEGVWSTPRFQISQSSPRLPRNRDLIRQEIAMHPIGTRILFAADHALHCDVPNGFSVRHNRFNDTFSIRGRGGNRDSMQEILNYSAYSPRHRDALRPSGESWRMTLRLPGGLERLEQLAWDLSRGDDGTELSPRESATAMVHHLRNSGQYTYSLANNIDDDTIDPVEDFLFNRKQGHCEYYASALTLMLRSIGIPARLISGFKGGTLNAVTGKFEVRQLHAHAWVEALIEDEWVVLDATPAARDESVASLDTSFGPFTNLWRLLQSWWSSGLFMNQQQQRRAVYEPLAELGQSAMERVRRVGIAQATIEWLRTLAAQPEEWISVPGFVTVFVLGVLLSALIWFLRKAWIFLRTGSLGRQRRQKQQQRLVAFYERFRHLVAIQGFSRDLGTTHREFAAVIERDWRHHGDVNGLASLPTELTDAFYRVRFGEQTLSDTELCGFEMSLNSLEDWVSGRPPNRRPETLA